MAEAKKVYEVIPEEDNGLNPDPYEICRELVVEHHEHLSDARIAIAWRFGWKADADGRLKLGQCKIASELDRDLHGYDLIVLLNHEAFSAVTFSREQQAALIDHELCHAMTQVDSDCEVKCDAEGRRLYRTRKHTIEEFHEIVARHGLWKGDVEAFAAVCMKSIEDGQGLLFASDAATPGLIALSGPAAKINRILGAVKALSEPEREAFNALLDGNEKAYHRALDKCTGMSVTISAAN